MTAYSLSIREYPQGASPTELESAQLDARLVQSLRLYAEKCGPYGLSGWAEGRGCPLHYVDNCWVRAEVLGRDLPDFFREVLGGEVDPCPEVRAESSYLIEAEEF